MDIEARERLSLSKTTESRLRDIFTRRTKSTLIKVGLINMMLIEVLQIVVNSLNNFIDTVITGQLLGTETLAAVGFFQPMLTIIGLEWIIIIGVQILGGQYVGRNNKEDSDKLLSLFASSIVFLGSAAAIFSVACFFYSRELALLLGAQGYTAILLADYIKGYSFGIIGQVLYPLLLWEMSFIYGQIRSSTLTIIIMMLANIFFDLLFIVQFQAGSFGLGLATSLSYLLTILLICNQFLTVTIQRSQLKSVALSFTRLNFKPLLKSARYGLPALMFNLGVTIKAYIMNITLMSSVGDAAVATMAVQGTLCGILGAIPMGCANAYMALGSMHYGSEDRFALERLSKVALKKCLLFSAAIMLLLMVGSSLIPSIFFRSYELAWFVAQKMLLLFPSFLIFNGITGILTKAYQFQKKDEFLINAIPLVENLSMAIFSATLTPVIGSNAVWLSFPAAEIFCLSLIAVTVFVRAGRITFKLADWIKLDKNFGTDESKFLERSFISLGHAMNASEDTVTFCLNNGIDERRANMAGIVVEELATNVVLHGAETDVDYNAYVRVYLGDKITIHVCDDTPTFNSLEQLDEEHDYAEYNIGLRLVRGIAEKFEYKNTAGLNNVIVTF